MPRRNDIDPELLSRMADQATTRRRFLGMGGLALGGLALGPAVLAACGSSTSSSSTDTTSAGGATGGASGSTMVMLNWPLYIEGDDPETSPTIQGFTKETGIKVDYKPDIDGNDSFNTKYQETLKSGDNIGVDLIVLTSWNAADYISLGLVEPWDDSLFPNKKNVIPSDQNLDWDPGRKYSIPWAIGQTALAYYPDKVGGEINDVNALFDPKYAGKVTILDEWRDSVGLTMLGMGYNPTTGTEAQMLEAVDKLGKARDAGQFKKVTGNSYTEDLTLGDTWLAMAWSGDIANIAKENPGLKWVVPNQGGMSFTDNALIPKGAKNSSGANQFMNYVYTPSVAGPLYESIQYVPPVQGALDAMTPEGKASPFVNPPATPKLYEFKVLPADQAETISRAYTAATEQ